MYLKNCSCDRDRNLIFEQTRVRQECTKQLFFTTKNAIPTIFFLYYGVLINRLRSSPRSGEKTAETCLRLS